MVCGGDVIFYEQWLDLLALILDTSMFGKSELEAIIYLFSQSFGIELVHASVGICKNWIDGRPAMPSIVNALFFLS